MRPINDPYGGVNPLIDKMIGNAYSIVKYVALNLKEICYLAENMQLIHDVAHGYRFEIEGDPAGATTLTIPLPDGMNITSIRGVEVVAHYLDQIYVAGADTFNYEIASGAVQISINSENTAARNAIYYATISTLLPSQME